MPRPASRRAANVAVLLTLLIPFAMLVLGWGLRGLLPTPKPRPGRLPEAHWSQLAPLATPRDDFGLAVSEGRIYVLGGTAGAGDGTLGSTEIYDPATDRWDPGPALSVGRKAFGAVALGRTIYAIGGATAPEASGAATDLVEALDTATGRWRRLAPLAAPRAGHAVVELGGSIYAIGGYRDGAEVGTVEVYDPASDRWTPRVPLPTPRRDLAAAQLGGKIYALGGRVNDLPSATVEVYDPATDAWTAGPPLNFPMASFGATVLDGRIHVLDGRVHRAFDPATGRWIAASSMPTPRQGQGVATVGEQLYAIGGRAAETQAGLNVTEALVPGPAPVAATPPGARSPGGSLAVAGGAVATLVLIAIALALGRLRTRRDAPLPVLPDEA